MDARQFDSFTRAVSRPRRAVTGGLLGLALAPLSASAKRKKRKKKKKKLTCSAPSFACGKNLCCGSNQQCVSGQCQELSPCGSQGCAGLTNPAMQGGV